MSTGDLLAVYRVATSHTSIDGNLVKRTSSDDGATWSSASTVLDDASDDLGDCTLTVLANGDISLTYNQTTSAGLESRVAKVMFSTDDGATWGSPVTITTSFDDWYDCSGPIIELANGDLLCPLYGQDTADSLDSARVSRSTDGGATWAHLADIADGPTLGRHMQEPNIVLLDNGDLLCTIRSDTNKAIYTSRSTDDGATWSTPVFAFYGSGRPALWQRSSDSLVLCMVRSPMSDKARFRSSDDRGLTWSSAEGDFTGNSSVPFMYGQWLELDTGQVAAVYSLGTFGGTDADMNFSKLAA